MRKDVFIDKHKWSNRVEDYNKFLTRIEDLKLYIVEFEENSAMKFKIYLSDFKIRGENHQLIIVITYDKCTFSTNNEIQRAWTRVRDTFLWPKGCGQGIMTLEFLLPFGWLNLVFLSLEQREKVVEKCRLLTTKTVEIFKYGKNNDRY